MRIKQVSVSGRKLLFISLAFAVVSVLSLLGSMASNLADHQISLERQIPASHVLVVALDSRTPEDAGLPDSLILLNLEDGSMESIPRDWQWSRIAPAKTLVEKHLGIGNCSPFCSIQGVYALSKLGQIGKASEEYALRKLVEVIRQEYEIPSLGVAVFDLTWAYSFLHKIGKVEVKISERLPVGGKDSNGSYTDIKRFLEPGPQSLEGEDLYWFARARQGSSNESRMLRQTELLSEIYSQFNSLDIIQAILSAKGRMYTDLSLWESIRLATTNPKTR